MEEAAAADVKATFEQWELFLAIVRNNYMRHDELTQLLNTRFRQLPAGLTVLDLGSGDGFMAYEALRDVDVAEYHAVDLSEEALRRLSVGTPAWQGRRTLHQGSFHDNLPALPDSQFDVVLASYSLHHLADDETDHVLAQIARVLKPAGWFVWTDCVRNEAESRGEYHLRLEEAVRNRWTHLTRLQQDQTVEHIRSRDLPVTLSSMTSLAAEYGLTKCQPVFQDEFFGSWVFCRPGAG